MVLREEGRKSQVLDTFSPDVVEPFRYYFLIFPPHGHGAVNITCQCLEL